jgi:hypothetical protein
MIDPLAFLVYLQQTFLPWHLKVLYTWPQLLPLYPHWQIIVSLATVAIIGIIGIWLFRKHKDIFFYYGAFFVLMIPYLNFQYIGIWVAERYLYFSAFCLLALALSLAIAIIRHSGPLRRISVLVIGVAFFTLNLFQKLTYEPVWRNGETLWRYHLTLPQPSPTAYENLAACCYADASAHQGTPRMALSMRKMAVVVDAGLAEFWRDRQQPPPPETYYLFFLQSIVQEVNGEPEAALESLLASDQLHPRFDAINLNLALLYRKLAETAHDARQRETYARAAKDRYAEYITLAFRGRVPPPDMRQTQADIEAEYRRAADDAKADPIVK